MLPKIKVLGIGGSGSNTVFRMAKSRARGVQLIAINTDAQALHFCNVPGKVLIGKNVTRGLGAGMDANQGKKAAEESKEEVLELLKGADLVFITSGMGGGTGSGAAPVIAEAARAMGILTVVVVTTPFSFEGEQRKKVATKALQQLKGKADSLLIISNDNLLKIIDEKTTVSNAFEMCDDILKQAVQSITDLVTAPGVITIDFNAIASVMKNSGQALFGMGRSMGKNRALEAATKAINSPLLDFSMKGSKGILFNVSGNDVTLPEIQQVSKIITEHVDPRAEVIFGTVKDNSLKKGEIKVTVIATKFLE